MLEGGGQSLGEGTSPALSVSQEPLSPSVYSPLQSRGGDNLVLQKINSGGRSLATPGGLLSSVVGSVFVFFILVCFQRFKKRASIRRLAEGGGEKGGPCESEDKLGASAGTASPTEGAPSQPAAGGGGGDSGDANEEAGDGDDGRALDLSLRLPRSQPAADASEIGRPGPPISSPEASPREELSPFPATSSASTTPSVEPLLQFYLRRRRTGADPGSPQRGVPVKKRKIRGAEGRDIWSRLWKARLSQAAAKQEPQEGGHLESEFRRPLPAPPRQQPRLSGGPKRKRPLKTGKTAVKTEQSAEPAGASPSPQPGPSLSQEQQLSLESTVPSGSPQQQPEAASDEARLQLGAILQLQHQLAGRIAAQEKEASSTQGRRSKKARETRPRAPRAPLPGVAKKRRLLKRREYTHRENRRRMRRRVREFRLMWSLVQEAILRNTDPQKLQMLQQQRQELVDAFTEMMSQSRRSWGQGRRSQPRGVVGGERPSTSSQTISRPEDAAVVAEEAPVPLVNPVLQESYQQALQMRLAQPSHGTPGFVSETPPASTARFPFYSHQTSPVLQITPAPPQAPPPAETGSAFHLVADPSRAGGLWRPYQNEGFSTSGLPLQQPTFSFPTNPLQQQQWRRTGWIVAGLQPAAWRVTPYYFLPSATPGVATTQWGGPVAQGPLGQGVGGGMVQGFLPHDAGSEGVAQQLQPPPLANLASTFGEALRQSQQTPAAASPPDTSLFPFSGARRAETAASAGGFGDLPAASIGSMGSFSAGPLPLSSMAPTQALLRLPPSEGAAGAAAAAFTGDERGSRASVGEQVEGEEASALAGPAPARRGRRGRPRRTFRESRASSSSNSGGSRQSASAFVQRAPRLFKEVEGRASLDPPSEESHVGCAAKRRRSTGTPRGAVGEAETEA